MATIKQERAAKILVGNGGNVTQAMIEAGYSKETANTPQKLTESKGFIEIWDEAIPNTLLAKRHKELLNKRELITFKGQEGNLEKIDIGPDVHAVTKGLDMAYKLKGSYAPEKSQALNLNIESRQVANPELEAIRLKFIEELKSKL